MNRCVWTVIALILSSGAVFAAEEKRELLSEHKTVATFRNVEFRPCRFRTALCPDRCGHAGHVATFDIVAYVSYKKPGQYGDPKGTTFMVMVEDSNKNPKVPKDIAGAVSQLKPGDYVLLDWRHEYVTRQEGGGSSSFPERPITKLQKITKEEADRLIK